MSKTLLVLLFLAVLVAKDARADGLIIPHIGIDFGGDIRPYALVGAGVIQPNGDAFDNALSFDDTKVAWDFGGGVMVFFSSHVGIRGDLRYFRTLDAADFLDLGDESGNLDFARGSLGFILRF